MKNFSRENLIISADDFGKSRLANENILALAQEGKIDRVAVLINRAFESSDIAAFLNSKVKIDLHLDIARFSQNSEKNKNPAGRIMIFLWHYFCHGLSARKITAEWEEQLEKFEKVFGRRPDGLNSHQYIHFFPPYFKIALKLAEKHKISYLRFGKIGISENVNSISGILNWLWKINASKFKKHSFDSSDFLASYDWVKDFPKFLAALPPQKTELVFHPERDEEFEFIKKTF